MIQPKQINASEPFSSTFGAHEAEVAAMWIVRFCQERGNWSRFSLNEIQDFYARKGGKGSFWFCCLLAICDTDAYHVMSSTPIRDKQSWIEQDEQGHYYLTKQFIEKCFKNYPA